MLYRLFLVALVLGAAAICALAQHRGAGDADRNNPDRNNAHEEARQRGAERREQNAPDQTAREQSARAQSFPGVLALLPGDSVTEHSLDLPSGKLAYTATAGT